MKQSFMLFALFIGALGYILGISHAENKYFSEGSENYLQGYKLDLPEEIANMKDTQDSSLDYFVGVRSVKDKTIHILYSNAPNGNNTVNSEFELKDYQLDLYQDSVVLYDHKRKVGIAMWSDSSKISPLESLILEDNL